MRSAYQRSPIPTSAQALVTAHQLWTWSSCPVMPSGPNVTTRVTIPQAFRNTVPAIGDDLIALMKDTSLISVIAAAELTYRARIYSGSSFRFREAFFVLAVFYVALTLLLSLLLQLWEKKLKVPGR